MSFKPHYPVISPPYLMLCYYVMPGPTMILHAFVALRVLSVAHAKLPSLTPIC